MKKLYLLLVVLFVYIECGHTQTVTLGTGTTTNGVTTSSPINIWFRRTVCQTVYTAAELNAAGITGAGTLNQIGYFVANPPIYALPGYTIQMKHTTDTDASGNLEGGYTTVKGPFTYAPGTNEWDMLTLDTPFAWDGVQNIVVRVCWSQVAPSWDPSGQLRTYPATNGYKFRRNDGAGSYCGSVPATVLDTKPQIRMIFDTVTVWTGLVNSDWDEQGNWSAGIPNETMHVSIPGGTPNNPSLTGTGVTKDIRITGTMSLFGTIQIHGNFECTGTYNDQGGVTVFTGEGKNTIAAGSSTTIDNLEIQSQDGTEVISGQLIIEDELRVVKGNFETGDAVTLKSDALGTARIDEIKTVCDYTLTMNDTWGDGWNGGVITVFEEGVEIGTYSGEGSTSTATFAIVNGNDFSLVYTSGSFENENSYTLQDEDLTTIFSDGPTPSTGTVFTSTATGCNFGPVIVGEISMERYIDVGETYWRYFSSAVEGATLEQYNDDFITAGYVGSHFPGFGWVSIYTYDETLTGGAGYVPATGSSQVIQTGEGLQVWSGDTITGTTAFTVDLVGVPHQGDIDLPVSFTSTGTPTEDGFCYVGNPYASTIDWDAAGWTKINMENATYIQNPDTEMYATYIDGASANGGSRFIASQQGFWVKASSLPVALTIRESCKASNDVPFFKAGEASNPGCNIRLSGLGMSDECVLRNKEGTVDAQEGEVDALKVWGAWGVNPQVSLINEEVKDLTVHTFDFNYEEWEVPLRTVVFESGEYTLEFINFFELGIPCMKLEDTYDGTMYDVTEESSLTFEMSDTTYAPRFILHLGKAYDVATQTTSCHDEADGQIEIDLNDESIHSYSLTSSDGTEYDSGTGNPLTIDNLPADVYTIVVDDLASLCGVNEFNVVVNAPSIINVFSEIENEALGSDGTIAVEVVGGTSPYSYLWSTGDIDNMITDLTPGLYSLTVNDFNDCIWEGEFIVGTMLGMQEEENDVKFIYFPDYNYITIQNWNFELGEQLSLYGVDGKVIQTYTPFSGQENQQIKLPENLAKGAYILGGREISFKFVK
jgi:hypothetical protein